jgi:glutamate racemase
VADWNISPATVERDGAIGVFDSGVGGLTVLRAIHDRLPNESTIYIGDLAHFPYGPKPQSEVCDRAIAIARYLEGRGVKAIVVACNTATSAAMDEIRLATTVPVVGVVEPGAEAAIQASRSKIVGVVATEGTVRSGAYGRAIMARCPEAQVTELARGDLVGMIEAGAAGSPKMWDAVATPVRELVQVHGCDTIILGCTHFPLLKAEFERAAGEGVSVLDSATATAAAVAEVIHSDRDGPTVHEFMVTAQASTFVRQARRLFGEQVTASVVEVATVARDATPELAVLR